MSQPPAPAKPRALGRQDVVPWAGAALVCVAGLAAAYSVVEPAPPDRIRIATGHVEGSYHALAMRYAAYMEAQGVTLELLPSAGSVENMHRLQAGEVELALVQGGVPAQPVEDDAPEQAPLSLASLGVEPLWVFSRKLEGTDLNALRGKRVACGELGSGTRALFEQVLADSGIGPLDLQRLPLGGTAALEALEAGQVDAVALVSAPDSDQVGVLGRDDRLTPLNLSHRDALLARHGFLIGVYAPRGVFSLQHDLPRKDLELVAAPTTLLSNPRLHPALMTLTLMAVHATQRRQTGVLGVTSEFPGKHHLDQPLADSAQHYYAHGPSLLYRWLPFWMANLVDRLKIMLIPLLTLLLPLSKVAPPLWRWRFRSRIYRWYSTLHAYDQQARNGPPAARAAVLDGLLHLEEELLAEVKVPPSYMGELYHLKLHVWLLKQRLGESGLPEPEVTEPAEPDPDAPSAPASGD